MEPGPAISTCSAPRGACCRRTTSSRNATFAGGRNSTLSCHLNLKPTAGKCPPGRLAGEPMKQPIFLLAALLVISPAWGEVTPTECDRMTSNPEDPDRVSPGVERGDIDLQKAITVCETELAADPANVRTRYQLARVLFYAGQTERAAAEMRRAADAGYRQAQFVFGALVSNKRDHAPADICVAEHYWLL